MGGRRWSRSITRSRRHRRRDRDVAHSRDRHAVPAPRRQCARRCSWRNGQSLQGRRPDAGSAAGDSRAVVSMQRDGSGSRRCAGRGDSLRNRVHRHARPRLRPGQQERRTAQRAEWSSSDTPHAPMRPRDVITVATRIGGLPVTQAGSWRSDGVDGSRACRRPCSSTASTRGSRPGNPAEPEPATAQRNQNRKAPRCGAFECGCTPGAWRRTAIARPAPVRRGHACAA